MKIAMQFFCLLFFHTLTPTTEMLIRRLKWIHQHEFESRMNWRVTIIIIMITRRCHYCVSMWRALVYWGNRHPPAATSSHQPADSWKITNLNLFLCRSVVMSDQICLTCTVIHFIIHSISKFKVAAMVGKSVGDKSTFNIHWIYIYIYSAYRAIPFVWIQCLLWHHDLSHQLSSLKSLPWQNGAVASTSTTIWRDAQSNIYILYI